MSEQLSASLTFNQSGGGSFVYEDAEKALGSDVAGLMGLGDLQTKRASHVEPIEGSASWSADMSPVGGPVLGPFNLRHEALAAERRWLRDFMGL